MNAAERQAYIEKHLTQAFSPNYLTVIDESDQHHGHPGHGGAGHYAIVIQTSCFEGLSKVEGHRKIYAALKAVIPNEIHALRISILGG